jgi:hypothetical protein
MAELPRLAAGPYVLFLFYKSQAASANWKPVFSDRPPGRIFATPGCVDVGEKHLPEGGRFWRTELAERASATIRR